LIPTEDTQWPSPFPLNLQKGFYTTDEIRDEINFFWASQDRISRLSPLETAAVCQGGAIPHPTLDISGNLQGETSTIRLDGEGIESFFTTRGKDNIVEVVDVGDKLCAQNNEYGMDVIDIYLGEGAASLQHFAPVVQAGEMAVYLKK
jgi:hypothetical protein